MKYEVPGLANCEREPIHIIGQIQSYGYLLALDKDGLGIRKASENIEQLIGAPAREIIGHSIDMYFSFSFLEYLQQLVEPRDVEDYGSLSFEHNKVDYVLSVHESDGLLVLEIERGSKKLVGDSPFHYPDLVESVLAELDLHDDVKEVCHALCERLRNITGFNRVMTYRFDEDDNGEVIAEVIGEGMDAYLGLKFPASDIPAQARRLYLQSTTRGIYDVEDRPVPLYPPESQEGVKPLDLSNSFLRSVSPIHIEYLKNMGVRASFSISIVVRGRLWGMILCHHTTEPVKLDVHQRRGCHFIGKMLSHKIENIDEDLRFETYKQQRDTLRKTISNVITTGNFHRAMEQNHELLMGAFESHYYALQYDGELRAHPDLKQKSVWALVNLLMQRNENIFYTDDLQAKFPEFEEGRDLPPGVLAIRLSQNLGEFLLLFRNEQVRQVKWAGKPTSVDGSVSEQLSPRNSFKLWTETVKGKSAAWSNADRSFAEELRAQLIEGIFKLTHEESAGNEDRFKKRAIETIYELQEVNQQLRTELEVLRKKESRSRWNRDVTAERSHTKVFSNPNEEGE